MVGWIWPACYSLGTNGFKPKILIRQDSVVFRVTVHVNTHCLIWSTLLQALKLLNKKGQLTMLAIFLFLSPSEYWSLLWARWWSKSDPG